VIALWLAYHVDLAIGLLPIYLMGVNALTHVATAVADRAYNPGLWTAIGVFLPVSVWGAIEIGDTADAGAGWQLIGLAFALALHAAIMGYIRGRARPRASA
jgi:Na+-translocating ferredoxin:NAD+ oxidoreductase RnfE subunit